MPKVKSLSSLIGNIKRNYPHDDFNPFGVMNFIYDNCLTVSAGLNVTVIGHTERFQKDTVRAWHHVMASRELLTGAPIPYPEGGDVTTHTGVVIRFRSVPPGDINHQKMEVLIKSSRYVLLCSRYSSPTMKQVFRAYNNTVDIWDVSKNNIKR